MMINAPGKRPAAPIPATARPTIRTAEEGDVAQIKLPISKKRRKPRYAIFSEKDVNILPANGWQAQLAENYYLRSLYCCYGKAGSMVAYVVKRNALPYHPTSSREWNSLVIVGMAWAGLAGKISNGGNIIALLLQVQHCP